VKNALLCVHLVGVISWMAGVLYLYRLIVYHVEESEPVVKARFRVMERRLYRYITLPAMIVAALAGLGMIALDPDYYLRAHWLQAKLALATLLVGATLYAGATVARLAAEQPVRGSRHFRIMNEVPTLLMIAIVILVVVKPG
jgi:putative membrane protein